MALTEAWTPITEKGVEQLTGPRLRLWLESLPQPNGKPLVQHACVPAGRQSLKTELTARRMPVHWLPIKTTYLDTRYLYVAPTQDQARSVVWEDYKKLIPAHWIRKVNETRMTIKTTWGTILQVAGADRPERVEGKSWNGIVRDECSDQKPGTWGLHLSQLVVARDGWSRHIGVPDFAGAGAIEYKNLCDYAASGDDPEWKCYVWPSSDVIPDSFLEREKKRLTKIQYEQEYNAQWVTAPGRAYWNYDANRHRDLSLRYDPAFPLLIGCDFNHGYHNWIVCQAKKIDGRTHYHFIDQVFLTQAATENMCHELKHLLADYGYNGTLSFYGDYSGHQHRSEATQTNWEIVQTQFPSAYMGYQKQGPIADRLNAVNAVLSDYEGNSRVLISPRCENLIRDLEFVNRMALYSQGGKQADLTHASDAAGYLIVQHEQGSEIIDYSKLRRAFGL